MNTLSIRLRYRPLRIGWCILSDDLEAYRRAARYSFTLWGGRFNPIIPVDDRALASSLVKLFRVDLLVPVSDDDRVREFISANGHLPWPMIDTELFPYSISGRRSPLVVDIAHPVTRMYGELIKNRPNPEPLIDLYEWDAKDPLSDVLLATLGGFPSEQEIGIDYWSFVQGNLIGLRANIAKDLDIPLPNPARETVSSLNGAYLSHRYHHLVRPVWPGLYVGHADNGRDLINFWNLLAADVPVKFFDARYGDRFRTAVRELVHRDQNSPRKLEGPNGLPLWHQPMHSLQDAYRFLGNTSVIPAVVDNGTWNGLNIHVPSVYFGQTTTLATIDADGATPAISFALLDKPFHEEVQTYYQHYVLSVDPGIGLIRHEQATLNAPFIPGLNNFYARAARNDPDSVRSEPDGLGLICDLLTESETLNALSTTELIVELFRSVGIRAEISKPGRVASTLLRQMGGLMGCRPFKIEGVRALIEQYRPDQAFSRSTALQTIRGQGAIRPLSEYQQLYIEPRRIGSELKNTDVLSYLLEKGVFRAGLKFNCPSCQLDFWRSLDDSRSRLDCDYCGHGFNASPQLRDKDWAFRRSGLFGNDDHQEGAVPVLLTLEQLMRGHRGSIAVFSPALSLRSEASSIPDCETDFAFVTKGGRDGRVQVAIGECKTRGSISESDVRNLQAVANVFPEDAYDVYIIFAKLADFSEEEVGLIRKANFARLPRVIMLTTRELESNFIYERVAEEFGLNRSVRDLKGMAEATERIFLATNKAAANVGEQSASL